MTLCPCQLARRFGLGPPGFLHQEGQGGVLLAPRFQLLAHRTGAWHQGHQTNALLQAQAQGPSTLGLTIGHDALDTLQAQGEALLNRERRFHTVAAVAIPYAHTQRQPAIATHPETEEHLFEIVAPVFAMPVGWSGASGLCGSSS